MINQRLFAARRDSHRNERGEFVSDKPDTETEATATEDGTAQDDKATAPHEIFGKMHEALNDSSNPLGVELRDALMAEPEDPETPITDRLCSAAFALLADVSLGGVPPQLQRGWGVQSDGSPIGGEYGKKARCGVMALMGHVLRPDAVSRLSDLSDAVRALFATVTGSNKGGAGKAEGGAHVHAIDLGEIFGRTGARSGVAAVLEALELRGPIRAAMRAAAQTFASALNDGAVDDAGVTPAPGRLVKTNSVGDDVREQPDGARTLHPVLGDEPYVLIRLAEAADGEQHLGRPVVAKLRVVTGGTGLGHGDDAVICPQTMLSIALRGVELSKADGVVLGEDSFGFDMGITDADEDSTAPGVIDIGDGLFAPSVPAEWPRAGSGNGARTEDPYGNRGNGGVSPSTDRPAAGEDGAAGAGHSPTTSDAVPAAGETAPPPGKGQ